MAHPIYHGQWQNGSTILQKLDGPIGNGEVEYPNGDSFKGFFHLEWGSRSSEAYTANGRYTFADGAYIDEAWIKTGSKEYPFSLYGFYRIRQNDETRSFTMFRNGYKVGFELILGEHPTVKMWDEGVELTPDKALEVLSYELDDSKGEDELRLTIILKDADGERKLIIQGGDLRQNSYGSYYYSPGYRVFVFEPNGDSREYGNNLPKNFQPYEGYITMHDAATGQCRYEVWENGQLDKAYDWNWDKQAARRVTLPHPLEEDKTLEALVWNGGHIVYQSSYYTYEGEIANDRPEGEGKLIYDDYDDDFHVYYGRFHDGRYCPPATGE